MTVPECCDSLVCDELFEEINFHDTYILWYWKVHMSCRLFVLLWLWYKTAHCGSDCKSFYWASFAEITQRGGDLSDCDRSLNNSKNKYNDE